MFLVLPGPFSGAQKKIWPQNIICIRDTTKVMESKVVHLQRLGHLSWK